MVEDNDNIQFFQRKQIIEPDQEGLAPVIDIFSRKRLNIKYEYHQIDSNSFWKKNR